MMPIRRPSAGATTQTRPISSAIIRFATSIAGVSGWTIGIDPSDSCSPSVTPAAMSAWRQRSASDREASPTGRPAPSITG